MRRLKHVVLEVLAAPLTGGADNVLGRSGDGGLDGRGVVKLGGILSFHVKFQCKRYKDTVSPSAVRDFRGAMVGRADKGLIILSLIHI